MSAYGQSIPAKMFLEYSQLSLTRQAFVNRICRMLDAVGMVYLESAEVGRRVFTNTTNLMDPANAEVGFNLSGNHSTSLLAFDYPTSETLTIGGVAYRPFVYIALDGNTPSSYSQDAYALRQVNVRHGLRRAGATFSYAQCLVWPWLNRTDSLGTKNVAGFFSSSSGDQTYGMEGGHTSTSTFIHDGMGAAKANWKQFSADGSTVSPVLLTATRWFAYLGPSGLVVSVGTGDAAAAQDRTTAFNIMNAMFLFGGARLPNRARTPLADINLNRIDPIVFIPGYAISNRYDSTASWYVHLLAIGHDLKSSVADNQPVYCRIQNFDNVDTLQKMSNTLGTTIRPIPSPRLVNGAGRHILSRLLLTPLSGYVTGGSQYTYAPYDDDYNCQVSKWEDCFTALSVRVTDNRAPLGLMTDPDTSIPWYIHYWNAADAGVALAATGLATISTLPTRAYGASTSYSFGAIPGPLPAATTLGQIASSPSAIYAYLRYQSGTTGQFTLASGNLVSTVATGNTATPVVMLEFELPAGDFGDRWMLQFDASITGGTENDASTYLGVDLYDPFYSAGWPLGWTNVAQYRTAGANGSNPNFTFSTRTAVALRVGPTATDSIATWYRTAQLSGSRLVVQFRLQKGVSSGTVTTTIGNFVLLKSRWQ